MPNMPNKMIMKSINFFKHVLILAIITLVAKIAKISTHNTLIFYINY